MRICTVSYKQGRSATAFGLPPRPIGVPMVRCVRFVVHLSESASVYPSFCAEVHPCEAAWDKCNVAAI